LRNGASGLVDNDSVNWVAVNNGTSISNVRKRDDGLLTSVLWVASSGVANINRVARNVRVGTEVLQWVRCVRHVANVVGASVVVVTVGVHDALWDRASSELYCRDISVGWVTGVGKARCVGRNWDRGDNATSGGGTRVSVALVGLSARDGGMVAHGGRRNLRVQGDTLVSGASVVVIAVSVNRALRNGASGLVENNSFNWVARNS
jgi:hypothetical protein